jgi:hypothetical protein
MKNPLKNPSINGAFWENHLEMGFEKLPRLITGGYPKEYVPGWTSI